MKSVTSKQGQTVFDIALQELGSIEGAFAIMALNQALTMDAAIASGTVVYLPDTYSNKRLADYLAKNGIKPVSASTPETAVVIQTVNTPITNSNILTAASMVRELSGSLDVEVAFANTLQANSIEIEIYNSWDGTTFSLVPDTLTRYGGGALLSVTFPFVEGLYLKMLVKPLFTINNTIEKIKYSYEKYF